MEKINCLIIDDEPLALDILETYIEKLPNLNLIARCENAFEANEILKRQEIDLLFLDIHMPQLSGIDFIKSLARPPLVIFTTAHPDYAVEGFELNAVDYLLKPISLDRFMKAVNKAEERLDRGDDPSPKVESVASIEDDYIFVKADKKLVRVAFDDILYIEGLKDYVIIRMDNTRVITLQTMKSLEQKLPDSVFKRVHRSFIVNIHKIEAIDGSMVEITEKGKQKIIPIGKNYKDDILNIINDKKL